MARRVERRERKRISIKDALRGHLSTISGAAAAALVESYAEACYLAYVGSLPCRTGITQFAAQIALQGWPGEVQGTVLHSAKRSSPILEHKNYKPDYLSTREKVEGVFVDDYRVKEARTAAGSGSPYNVKVAVRVRPGFAKRMVQAAQPGSRSKIRELKLTMWSVRMAYDEPISQIILSDQGIGNFALTPFQDGDTRERWPFSVLLHHYIPKVPNALYEKALKAHTKHFAE